MKANTLYLLLLLPLITFTGCRKRPARELPFTTTFTKPCLVNGVDVVDVIFVTQQMPMSTQVFVYFRNASGSKINDAKVLIEVCNSLPQNYMNCTTLDPINIGPLTDTGGYQRLTEKGLSFVAPETYLDSAHINVGLLSYDTATRKNALAGNYENNYATTFTTTTAGDTILTYARGYVFCDGNSLFRLKLINGDSSYYNIYGYSFNNTTYSGNIYNPMGTLISTVSLGGSPKSIVTANDSFRCVFNITTPIADSINAINIDLGQ